jgi:hypothetical protein
MALAHAVGDKVEAAYRRSDLFTKRRRMMEERRMMDESGGKHCDAPASAGKILNIGSAATGGASEERQFAVAGR